MVVEGLLWLVVSMEVRGPALPHTGPAAMYWRDHTLSTVSEMVASSVEAGNRRRVRVSQTSALLPMAVHLKW